MEGRCREGGVWVLHLFSMITSGRMFSLFTTIPNPPRSKSLPHLQLALSDSQPFGLAQ